ncbi:MAG TPA: helix-turn-helix domain-containing protein [Patescibacteria group bacterium]|jgi:DNA-binding XRE family transcriptional regulator|nr:helix-turn-helix domain-containing protein [Patescibacteria group bacterium]
MSPEYRLTLEVNLPDAVAAAQLTKEVVGIAGIVSGGEPNSVKSILLEQVGVINPKLMDKGAIIKQERECLGLSQSQLAQLVGISRATVSLIERGKARTSIPTVFAIAEKIGISRSDPRMVTLLEGAAPVPHRIKYPRP